MKKSLRASVRIAIFVVILAILTLLCKPTSSAQENGPVSKPATKGRTYGSTKSASITPRRIEVKAIPDTQLRRHFEEEERGPIPRPAHAQYERPPRTVPQRHTRQTIRQPTGAVGPSPVHVPGSADSLLIAENTDLTTATNSGWEPNVATNGVATYFSTNYGNAFRPTAASAFSSVDPYGFMSDISGGFCCDQVLQYIPSIDRFVWVAQSNLDKNNENVYRIGVASPQELAASGGAVWTTFDLKSHDLLGAGDSFDYPEIAYDDKFLFLSCDDVGTSQGMLARIPLAALSGSVAFPTQIESTLVGGWFNRPVQNTTDRGVFAGQYFEPSGKYVVLQLYTWNDDSASIQTWNGPEFPISSDWQTLTPNGNDWLGTNTKVGEHIYGATQMNNTILVAWNSGRQPPVLPYPFIDMALIDSSTFALLHEEIIWSPQFAYAYPALATSSDGFGNSKIGISLSYGGPATAVAHAVGFRNGDYNWKIQATTTSQGLGGGGHYLGIRPFPSSLCFAAAGYVAVPDAANQPYGYTNDPLLVVFGPASTSCP